MGFATEEQAKAIFEAIKERDEDRAARLPDHRAALDHACVARERLRALGWREGVYCPKDGSEFALIQWGSTGVHLGWYMGEWPTGNIYCGDFMVEPEAVMFKPLDELSEDEAADLDRSVAADKEFMDRQIQAFTGADHEPRSK